MGTELVLAGDIGGTKSVLALFDRETGPLQPMALRRYRNCDLTGPGELVADFLAHCGRRPGSACFGVAGPVLDGRVRMTKLGWCLDSDELARALGCERVELVNDMVAMAEGAVLQPRERVRVVNRGRAGSVGPVAVLAPGTGLGEAFLLPCDSGTVVAAGEGGHGGFAPVGREQADLLTFLVGRRELVSIDSVCSGPGLADLFAFLATRLTVSQDLVAEVGQSRDPAPLVVRRALAEARQGVEGICGHCVRLFLDILAAEAANMALRVLALGGVYIGGGLVPRVVDLLEEERFMTFFARGVHGRLLAAIPVFLLLDPLVPLAGAAAIGLRRERL